MPRKGRTIESRVREHRKFREQSRRRIRPGVTLAAITVALLVLWRAFAPSFFSYWVAAGILGFVIFNVGMEVFSFRSHTKKLRKLGFPFEEQKPNQSSQPTPVNRRG